MLNNMMDQEARAEQARRQILYNIGHCKYSPSHCLSGCCFIRNNSSLSQHERGVPDQLLALKKKRKEKRKIHSCGVTLALKFHFTFQCLVPSSMPIIRGMLLVRDGIESFRWLNCHYYSIFPWIIDLYRRIYVGIFMISPFIDPVSIFRIMTDILLWMRLSIIYR